MKIYSFGYYSEEGSSYYLLTCVNDYTEEQFKELCADLYVEAFKKSIEEWGKDRADNRVDDLFNTVLETLILNFGFNEIKSNCTFKPFGWASIIENDWNDIKSKDLELIRNKTKML